jgi:aliphatic sulfonates family ABC transporter substrate-binding protein
MTLMRRLLLAIAVLALAAGTARAQTTLRIGYQKNGALVILKQQRQLETELGPRGIAVQWVEFQSGPPLLEALNAGGIDFGATGDTPPVFAQAAGVPFVYVGAQPVSGRNAAVLVRKDGPIASIADLRGLRVAVTKGSSAHYQLVRTLHGAGLSLSDIQPVYLQPADAAAAFRAGGVAAWTIWDPFYAIAEHDPGTRVLTDGTIAPSNGFFLARRDYAEHYPAVIVTVLRAANGAAAWSEAHQDDLARIMAEVTGVDVESQRVAAARGTYRVDFLNDGVIRTQQGVADTFHALGVIPAAIDVRVAVWLPPAGSCISGDPS